MISFVRELVVEIGNVECGEVDVLESVDLSQHANADDRRVLSELQTLEVSGR